MQARSPLFNCNMTGHIRYRNMPAVTIGSILQALCFHITVRNFHNVGICPHPKMLIKFCFKLERAQEHISAFFKFK